jgi:hypothetical protein
MFDVNRTPSSSATVVAVTAFITIFSPRQLLKVKVVPGTWNVSPAFPFNFSQYSQAHQSPEDIQLLHKMFSRLEIRVLFYSSAFLVPREINALNS